MILNVGETTIISFTHKSMSINFNYKLCNNLILRFHCFKDLRVLLACKLCLHHHFDYIFSQSLIMLVLIHYITFDILTNYISLTYIL
jgi:hypothetical protein